MKRIRLTRGMWTTVDNEDFERLASIKWKAAFDEKGKRWTANRVHVAYSISTRRRIHFVFPMADYILGRKPGMIIDHRNLDALDNRRSNLRYASRTQNAQNKRQVNRWGFKGVSCKKGRFSSRITVNGHTLHLGYFATAAEAGQAYDAAARIHFGEFAQLNNSP